jgi:hypothetical protein
MYLIFDQTLEIVLEVVEYYISGYLSRFVWLSRDNIFDFYDVLLIEGLQKSDFSESGNGELNK